MFLLPVNTHTIGSQQRWYLPARAYSKIQLQAGQVLKEYLPQIKADVQSSAKIPTQRPVFLISSVFISFSVAGDDLRVLVVRYRSVKAKEGGGSCQS